jgi:hypothetical protein
VEFDQPDEQRHYSGFFDKSDRLLGRYPGQLPFAFLGPFFELLFDLKEKDLNCRGPYFSRFQLLEIGIHPERGRADDSPLDPRLFEGFLRRGFGG